MKSSFKKTLIVILTTLALMFSALGVIPAQAASAWYDGSIQYSTITNCASIIQGSPYQEYGAGTYVGFLSDPSAGQPAPNATYYIHVVISGLGNSCSGMRAYLDITLPANTSLAIDATNPVYCFYDNALISSSDCPQSLPLSSYNSGAYAIFSTDGANANTWPVPQGHFLEFQIPVRSSTALSNSAFQANVFMLDGNSSPWLHPQQGVYVFTAPTATLTVTNTNDSGAGSLRNTIASASASDTITFDSALSGETIHLASTLTLSKNVTIDGSALASKITISGDSNNDGTGDVSVFHINSGVAVTLDSLTIAKGMNSASVGFGGGIYNAGTLTVMNSTFSGNSASVGVGGGIANYTGTLTLTNSTFSGNSALGGGGIYNGGGTLTLTNSTFSGNSAGVGGGIYNDGALTTVTNSTFSGNSTSLEDGGGIANNTGMLVVINSTFSSNSAHNSGGGINNYYGTLTVTNSIFTDNSASNGGGGISNYLGALAVTNSTFTGNYSVSNGGGGISNNNDGTLTVTNSTFSNNSAYNGGGILNTGTLTVANSTLAGNSATYGGGIYSEGSLTLANSTFTGNSATTNKGGGIYNEVGSILNYANTIIANSTAGGDCANVGRIGTNTNNLVEDGSCAAPLSGDPNLGALASNGGPTQTFALLAGSSAIDTGNDAICAADPVNNIDQRGTLRPVGAHCDIGSYEYQSLNVKSTGAQDGWILESGEKTNVGGTLNAGATTFNLGDNAAKKQYRGILSFNTGAGLPDTAVITNVILKVRKQGVTGGGNPISTFQGFMVDIKKGMFGATTLQTIDFQSTASKTYGPFSPSLVSNWYSINLTSGKNYINKLSTNNGSTQIRLRFKLDDNNNLVANYLSLFSGNASAAYRPQLIIEYYLP